MKQTTTQTQGEVSIDVDYSGQTIELSVDSVVNCIESQFGVSLPRTHEEVGLDADNPELFAVAPLLHSNGYVQYGDLTTTMMETQGTDSIMKPVVYYDGYKYIPEVSPNHNNNNNNSGIDRIDSRVSTTDGNYNINIIVEQYNNITPETTENEYMIVDADAREEELSDALNISELAYSVSVESKEEFTFLVSDSEQGYSITATKTDKNISLVQSKQLDIGVDPTQINPSIVETEQLYQATLLYNYKTNKTPYEIAYNTEDEHFSIIDKEDAHTVNTQTKTVEEKPNGIGINTYQTKYTKLYSQF